MDCAGGCVADRIYALHDDKGRVRRFSFSKSLLKYLGKTYLPGGSLKKHTLILGRELNEGVSTEAKLFAICDKRKGTILRVQTSRDYAEALLDSSRYLTEAWIQKEK